MQWRKNIQLHLLTSTHMHLYIPTQTQEFCLCMNVLIIWIMGGSQTSSPGCCRTWRPEFSPHYPRDKRASTPKSCSLTSIYAKACTRTHDSEDTAWSELLIKEVRLFPSFIRQKTQAPCRICFVGLGTGTAFSKCHIKLSVWIHDWSTEETCNKPHRIRTNQFCFSLLFVYIFKMTRENWCFFPPEKVCI